MASRGLVAWERCSGVRRRRLGQLAAKDHRSPVDSRLAVGVDAGRGYDGLWVARLSPWAHARQCRVWLRDRLSNLRDQAWGTAFSSETCWFGRGQFCRYTLTWHLRIYILLAVRSTQPAKHMTAIRLVAVGYNTYTHIHTHARCPAWQSMYHRTRARTALGHGAISTCMVLCAHTHIYI